MHGMVVVLRGDRGELRSGRTETLHVKAAKAAYTSMKTL